ncbi:predicted protein [Nematostella vectensis]|uniref:Transmembrane protein 72 n=1 Tax=Nematostella vectensis TaxID=45351 RepID=A7SDD8_NEMVE|nr:predicted protein [Nematostella vectensis]|eukprot:XP_001630373.1 predicted protein [Nematostella vectensis]
MANGEELDRSFFWRHFTTFTRILGLATCVAMWWVGILLIDKPDKRIAVYLLITGASISFLEIIFIIDKCACCKEGSFGFSLWKFLRAFDNWKKFLLYVVLSSVCYLHPTEYWQGLVVGVMLDILAFFYLIRTFRKKNEREAYKYRQLEVK